MKEQFFIQELANGLTLLGQPIAHASSAAVTFLLPAGASRDPDSAAGAASVATEWLFRGAGERDTRQLNDALDSLGCHRNESVRSEHVHFSAAQLGRNLPEVLPIYADILRRPRVEEETFRPCRGLVLQDLASLEDEPARKCNTLVRERFYPPPLGRCVYGNAESLTAMTAGQVREDFLARLGPAGTIVAVAGNFDWDAFCGQMDKLFGDWQPQPLEPVDTAPPPGGVTHIAKESAQTHIGLAHPAVTVSDEHYYPARVAETVLSGGMSGRLFTEVREKRGLVYHVSSRYHSLKNHAGIFTYAGTRPEVAQQTLEVTVGELRRLAEGVEPEELDRARTQLKSALIMQGESTSSRATSLAGDWYHLGRLRSLQELSDAIDAVQADDVVEYLQACPAEDFTVLVIGPEGLDTAGITER